MSRPTVLVSRRARTSPPGWDGARSWLGGLPTLGAIPWPRGPGGVPCHFLAQIDLAEVAGVAPESGLPTSGALAFFVGGGPPVVYVAPGTEETPTSPPDGTPDLTQTGGEWGTDLDGRPIHPRWPVSFTAVPLPPVPDDDDGEAVDAWLEQQAEAVAALTPGADTYGTPKQAFAGPPLPDWWQVGHHYAGLLAGALRDAPTRIAREEQSLRLARESGAKSVEWLAPKVAKMQALEPAFAAFTAEVEALVAGRDPWAVMAADERTSLERLWARNAEFDLFHSNSGRFPLAYLKDRAIDQIPGVGAPGWDALPDYVRARMTVERAPRPRWLWEARRYARSLQDAAVISVAAHAKARRERIASLRSARARLPSTSPKVAGVEEAIGKEEAALAAIVAATGGFARRAAETAVWGSSLDPWAPMDADGVVALVARMAKDHADFPSLASGYVPKRIEDLEREALYALATADDRGYHTLPASARAWIDDTQRRPNGGWHQMFGRAKEIQGDTCAMREEGYVLLLQLVADVWMGWSFGDVGAYTFWIDPADLAAERWDAAKLVFECH